MRESTPTGILKRHRSIEPQGAYRRQLPARRTKVMSSVYGVALAVLLTTPPAFAGDGQGAKTPKPRYTMPSGRGWGVCEAYLKFLNSTPANEEPPMCDLKLGRVPGMKEPDWEVLDIEQHLPYVHQIELIIGKFEIEPEPEKDFAAWQVQRKERINKLSQQPRLRRAKLALVQGGPVETVLVYDFDTARCAGEVKKARQGHVYDMRLDRPHFFALDAKQEKVIGDVWWLTDMRGQLLIYGGAPYYMNQSSQGDMGENAAYVFVNRIQPLNQTLSANQLPYMRQELCRIRFDYPFPPLKIK